MITFSNSLGLQFWRKGEPSFNETIEAGVNKKCYFHPWNSEDVIPVWFVSDEGLDFILKVYSDDMVELASIAIPEIAEDIFYLDFIPEDHDIENQLIYFEIVAVSTSGGEGTEDETFTNGSFEDGLVGWNQAQGEADEGYGFFAAGDYLGDASLNTSMRVDFINDFGLRDSYYVEQTFDQNNPGIKSIRYGFRSGAIDLSNGPGFEFSHAQLIAIHNTAGGYVEQIVVDNIQANTTYEGTFLMDLTYSGEIRWLVRPWYNTTEEIENGAFIGTLAPSSSVGGSAATELFPNGSFEGGLANWDQQQGEADEGYGVWAPGAYLGDPSLHTNMRVDFITTIGVDAHRDSYFLNRTFIQNVPNAARQFKYSIRSGAQDLSSGAGWLFDFAQLIVVYIDGVSEVEQIVATIEGTDITVTGTFDLNLSVSGYIKWFIRPFYASTGGVPPGEFGMWEFDMLYFEPVALENGAWVWSGAFSGIAYNQLSSNLNPTVSLRIPFPTVNGNAYSFEVTSRSTDGGGGAGNYTDWKVYLTDGADYSNVQIAANKPLGTSIFTVNFVATADMPYIEITAQANHVNGQERELSIMLVDKLNPEGGYGLWNFNMLYFEPQFLEEGTDPEVTTYNSYYYTDRQDIKPFHKLTRWLAYSNDINYDDLPYGELETKPVLGIRLKSKFAKPRSPEENEKEEFTTGRTVKTYSSNKNQLLIQVDPLPPYMNTKVGLILNHSSLFLRNKSYIKEGSYETKELDEFFSRETGEAWLTENPI